MLKSVHNRHFLTYNWFSSLQLQIPIQISIWSPIRYSTVQKRAHNRHFLTYNWFSSLFANSNTNFNKISIWSPIRHSTVLKRVHNRHLSTYIWFSNHSDFTTAFYLVTTRRAYCSATGIVTQAWRPYTGAPKQKKREHTKQTKPRIHMGKNSVTHSVTDILQR